MTTMPRELARKQPANAPLLIVDEAHKVMSRREIRSLLDAMAAEMRRRQAVSAGQPPSLTAGQLWFLRIGALALVGFGLACMVIASMQQVQP